MAYVMNGSNSSQLVSLIGKFLVICCRQGKVPGASGNRQGGVKMISRVVTEAMGTKRPMRLHSSSSSSLGHARHRSLIHSCWLLALHSSG